MDSTERMIQVIKHEVRATSQYLGKEALNPRVLEAMRRVPREAFVPTEIKPYAYEDSALSIGHGQTISQPYMVAIMSDLLNVNQNATVLEIGTGSGYQAAVLSQLVQQVYSIERIPELAESAAGRLKRLGYRNILVRQGNGYQGWQAYAPYDGIIVTAAAPYIPEALITQLRTGGRMMIPIGEPHMLQELMMVSKRGEAQFDAKAILDVAFVPLLDED